MKTNNYVPAGTKFKIDRRFNQFDGKKSLPCVYAGMKNKNRTTIKKVQNGLNYAKASLCIMIIAAAWFMCYSNNQPKPETAQAQTEEVPSTVTLTSAGFESAEIPAGYREPTPRESIEQTIRRYFGKDAEVALAVAKAESGLNPQALGDTNTKYPSAGIFQIRLLPGRNITKDQMFDVEANIAYAKALYDRSGWYPWSAWKNGSFKKHLGGK